MAQETIIQQVDSSTFESQKYIPKDEQILSSFSLDTTFSQDSDIIEVSIYDENKNKIYNYVEPDNGFYTVLNGDVILEPEQNLATLGFNQGSYYIKYDFFRKRIASDSNNSYFISEISSERDEIRLISHNIPNDEIIKSVNNFINYRDNASYFVDFYLNLGNNNLVIANNIKLEQTQDIPSVLIKLYEPLPLSYSIKDIVWVEESISNPQTYLVEFPEIPVIIKDYESIKGPNFSLNVKDQVGSSTQIFSFDHLRSNSNLSLQQQIDNILQNKGIDLNIDYENYHNFVHFSSIKTRLENFYYKASLIESYQNDMNNISNNTDGLYNLSYNSLTSSISTIINGFDGYEHFLYFNSGSLYSWPKQNDQPPYQLYSTGSSQVINWFERNYASASLYDENNQDYLYWTIPEYLRNDSENRNYELFLDMIGQHFDSIYIYINNITNKFNADNRLKYGISKTLVADAIKDFGVKLYSNNFNINDLYIAFLGLTPSGDSFPFSDITNSLPASTGYKYVNTKVSSSNNNIIPLNDLNTQIYKRIYHNLPYLLKTKGTITGLRALITTFGIPDTILRINEFGGKDKNNSGDWDYSQNVYNYAFDTKNGGYMTTGFIANDKFGNDIPNTIQLRFKTNGIPTNPYQTLFNVFDNNGLVSSLVLEYISPAIDSYSGSIDNPLIKHGNIKFIPNISNPDIWVANPIPFPIFNGDWWSIQITNDTYLTSLYIANKIDDKIGHKDMASISGIFAALYPIYSTLSNATTQSIGGISYFPFEGQFQELRFYNNIINENSFYDYVLNPLSCEGNSINSTPDELFFRAPLGSTSDLTNISSIHPKVTGSWATASFSNGTSNFTLSSASFSPNYETIYYDQPVVGIKNTITDKIDIVDMVLPIGNTLSPFRSIQQKSFTNYNYTPDINYLEISFSPQDQINEDIMSQIGYINIGDYIGDPSKINESGNTYPDLDKLRNEYFLKYRKNYDVKDFVELIKYFDNSLFKMLKDFIPAKTETSTGIVIKQHLLERNKQQPVQASYENETYTSSIKNLPNNYADNALLYTVEGGDAGSYEHIKLWHITQSWSQNTIFPYQPTSSNPHSILRNDQREFYNGELPGSSTYNKLTEHCQQYKTGNTSSFNHDLDCQPYFNNFDKARPNPNLQDVDYSIGIATPVNINLINSNNATRGTVPESNYTLKRHILPRYEGSRASSDGVNLSTGLTGSYDNYPPVELKKTHFAYIDKISDPYPVVNDSTNFNIKYIIDSETNIDNPGLNDITYYNLIDTFSDRENIKVSLTIPKQEPQFINLNNEQSIRYVGKIAVPILYSQISSDRYSDSIPLTSSNANSSGIINYGESSYETNMNNIFGKNDVKNFNLQPVKITSNITIKDPYGRVDTSTDPIQDSGIIKATNLNADYKISWKIKIPSTVPQTILFFAPTVNIIYQSLIPYEQFNASYVYITISYSVVSWGNGTPVKNGLVWSFASDPTIETADASNVFYNNNLSTGVQNIKILVPFHTNSILYIKAFAENTQRGISYDTENAKYTFSDDIAVSGSFSIN